MLSLGQNFDWNHARSFLAVAELGSLSAAARALGQTQPTIGRQISIFEENLGLLLFDRIGRSLVLTDTGRELLPQIKAMNEAAEKFSIIAQAQSESMEGEVTITASDVMVSHNLVPLMAELRAKLPDITFRLHGSDRLEDLRRREADIAIRHARPEEPELIARRIAETPARLYGSSSYFERIPYPETPENMINHEFVGAYNLDLFLSSLKALGLHIEQSQFHIITNSGDAIFSLIAMGLGLSYMPVDIAHNYPNLRAVECAPTIKFPTWLVAHRELHANPALRAVFDYLGEELGKTL